MASVSDPLIEPPDFTPHDARRLDELIAQAQPPRILEQEIAEPQFVERATGQIDRRSADGGGTVDR